MTALEFSGSLLALVGHDGIRGYDCAERREIFHYVPISNLSANMSCITWQPQLVTRKKTDRKVKPDLVAVGCSSGEILIVSVKRQKLVTVLKDEECDSVTSIDWSISNELFSGSSDGRIFCWDFKNAKKARQWKGHDSSVGSIRCTPTGSELLSASRNIKLWDLKSNVCLTTFSGHEAPVSELRLSWSNGSCHEECVIISAAKGDRYLYVWPFQLKGKVRKPLCTFAIAKEPLGFTVATAPDKANASLSMFFAVYIMVTGEDGRLDIFFLQISSSADSSVELVCSVGIETNESPSKRLPILAAHMLSSNLNVTLLYGFSARLAIELLHLNTLKQEAVLKREDPLRSRSIALLENSISKVKRPIVSEKRTNFLFSEGASSLRPQKKSKKSLAGVSEDSMETRLVELFRETKEKKVDDEAQLANHSLAVLLVQGLHSRDKEILTAVLQKTDEQTIKPTVRAVPSAQIVPLLEHIGYRLRQEKIRHSYYLWLKHVVAAHSNYVTTPAKEVLYDIFRQINARMPLLSKVVDLSERLAFLTKRWSCESTDDVTVNNSHAAELNGSNEQEGSSSDESEDSFEFEQPTCSESLWTKISPLPLWERGKEREDARNESGIDLRSVVSERRTGLTNGHATLDKRSFDETTSSEDESTSS
ncbi:Utp12 and WD40 domain containing protein [Trichuris trichiura]|uniref:Utp12 and WD40 domain containing protein n=1 Tax=Trichuris trichiura TaxID=36087 RepID=A0A077Z317_TRITR|nr:Utp12 and WD40 domain containing protein [Trichuris trichiura]